MIRLDVKAYEKLCALAEHENRSISGEAKTLTENALNDLMPFAIGDAVSYTDEDEMTRYGEVKRYFFTVPVRLLLALDNEETVTAYVSECERLEP